MAAMALRCGVAGLLGDDRFEHRFGIDAGGHAMSADGFTGGRSDWYHFSGSSRASPEDYRHHMRDLELNDDEQVVVRVAAQDAFAAAEVGSPTITMRNYLSTHHLHAARYAAEAAQELEAQHEGALAFNIRLRGLVLSAVAESVMFLEAAINEIFQDATDGHHSYVGSLGEGPLNLMAAFWEATEEGRRVNTVLVKYKWALKFCGQDSFDEGSSPYQDVKLLIDLRNYLVHYRPQDVGHSLKPPKWVGGLINRFPGNRLMAESGNPWFPDIALGAGCAAWAWRSARALTDQLAAAIGLELNYQLADFGDPLPK